MMLKYNTEILDLPKVIEIIMSNVPHEIKLPLSDYMWEARKEYSDIISEIKLKISIIPSSMKIPDEYKNSYINSIMIKELLDIIDSGLNKEAE